MSLIYLHPDVNYPRMLQKYFYRADLRSMKRLFTSEVTIRAMGAYRNALEIQERIGEYTMFQGNLVRRHAQLFEGATNKFASFLASMTMMFAAAGLIVEGLALVLFLEHRYPARVRGLVGPGATAMADRTPQLDTAAWVLLMFVVGYFSYRFWRTAVKLREKGAVQRQVAPF
jgi:hypothetical protein